MASTQNRSYCHIHLVSDATGETLISISRATAAQYPNVVALEHVYPLIRSSTQLDRVLKEIEYSPGIVLYTIVDQTLSATLLKFCQELGIPCLGVMDSVFHLFQSYLGTTSSHRPGAQHMLNTEYFKRIDALNFTLAHDDGQMTDNLANADVVLLGISRTSKTPTSIYLANRGIKTANVPLVPGVPLPAFFNGPIAPLAVGLIASPERIIQIRQNRLLALNADAKNTTYVDKITVTQEVAHSRRLFAERGWPVIDVSRRSIEETAAEIIDLYRAHRLTRIVEG